MNIGIFVDSYYPIISGVVTSTMMLKKELTARGHNVYIFTTSNPEADKNNEENIIRLPSLEIYFLKPQRAALVYPPKVLFNIKKYELDIVHTQTEFALGIFGKIVSEFFRIPLIHTYHTMYADYVHYIAKGHIITPTMVHKLSRLFCNRASVVITPGEKTKNILIEYGVKVPIRFIPSGIDFEPFSSEKYSKDEIDQLKAEIGLNLDDKVIVSVGRTAKEKSIDVIINQLPNALEKIPNLKFVIVGDGPALGDLKDLAKKLGVEHATIFTGSRPWAEIGKYYKLGQAFVSASTSETQGLTYIESMAAGVPVVAKRDLTFEKVIIDNVTGFYFDDESEISDVLFKALTNDELLAEVSKNAFENIQDLSSAKFAEKVESLYTQVIEWKEKTSGRNLKFLPSTLTKRIASVKNVPKAVFKGKLNIKFRKIGKTNKTKKD